MDKENNKKEYIDKEGFLLKLRHMGYFDDEEEEKEIYSVADLFTVVLQNEQGN